jgi:hypothetical protein
MATPATPEPNREATAYLAAARKLRHALTERDKLVAPHRERYDRSQDDLRMMAEKRVQIAGEFMRAALTADHVYEEYVNEALDEYRERMSGGD